MAYGSSLKYTTVLGGHRGFDFGAIGDEEIAGHGVLEGARGKAKLCCAVQMTRVFQVTGDKPTGECIAAASIPSATASDTAAATKAPAMIAGQETAELWQ